MGKQFPSEMIHILLQAARSGVKGNTNEKILKIFDAFADEITDPNTPIRLFFIHYFLR